MHDRPKAGHRETRGDTDQQLLADADVDHPLGVRVLGFRHSPCTDVREHHGDPLVGSDVEAVAHRCGHAFGSTTAMTACGRPTCSNSKARSSAA